MNKMARPIIFSNSKEFPKRTHGGDNLSLQYTARVRYKLTQ